MIGTSASGCWFLDITVDTCDHSGGLFKLQLACCSHWIWVKGHGYVTTFNPYSVRITLRFMMLSGAGLVQRCALRLALVFGAHLAWFG